jgi:hypothetical protein
MPSVPDERSRLVLTTESAIVDSNPEHGLDKQIAAIALVNDLTVVTRHAADFEGTGVRLLNPFVDVE